MTSSEEFKALSVHREAGLAGQKCRELQHNKAFKTDSQRSAFLVCFSFIVYGTIL